MADVDASQLRVFAASHNDGGDTLNTQLRVFAMAVNPSQDVEASQMMPRAVVDPLVSGTQASQMRVYAVAKGRVTDPIIRVWTYTMDGHNYYVIRLPQETLVYDLAADQWYTWGNDDQLTWRANDGINWLGGTNNAYVYGSNVIVGDENNGALYWLDPDADLDEGPVDDPAGNRVRYKFTRTAFGQALTRSFDVTPCYSLQLLGSAGEADVNDLRINLATSDDWGHTYQSQGDMNVPYGDYVARVDWMSLGSVSAPGRIFRITDYGALKRIDSLEMDDGNNG